MRLKWKKWLFLAILALAPILSGCEGCDKDKYVAPPPAPSAPSNLTAAATSPNEINLNWQDNSTSEEGFYVYRRITGDYARAAILSTNATSYSDTGLMSETTYWYKVTAYNDGGESDQSNEVSVATPGEPPPPPEPLEAPTGLRADVVSYKLVLLSWEDNSSDEDGFKVHCRMDETVYLTIATLGPDSTFFRHDFLQPMTALEYYIEVYRGDELAGSEQAYVTTPCPVTATTSGYSWPLETLVGISGSIESNASEACRADITVFAYHYSTWDLLGSAKETFELEPFEWKHLYIEVEVPGGHRWIHSDVEVTDVEILY